MTQFQTGADALNALNASNDDGGKSAEFSKFSSGTTYTVKVPGLHLFSAYVYGSFSKGIHSFVAENPSKKTDRGYPTENLTPFDKAWKFFKDKSDDWQDDNAQEAYQFIAKQRFSLGFINLDDGAPIVVEFTKNQAKAVVDSIKKYESRLDQFAFELSKQGKSRDTTVSLSIIPILEDLTETQQKNFAESTGEFDDAIFDGIHYAMSDNEQIETLIRVGFDVKLIGLEAPKQGAEGQTEGAPEGNPVDNTQVAEPDLPF